MTSKIAVRALGIMASLALVLGIGLATSLPAEAAKRTVWDQVAQCESGANWKINTGNGYYGGLQFSARTWAGFGGKKYASRANKATKGQQIAIARRVLAGQGAGAWATCGRRAGLTKHNGKADRHATPSSNPGVSTHKSTKSDKAKKSAKAKKSEKAKKKAAHKKKHSATKPSSSHKTIQVKRGDTIRKIAKRYDVKGGWKGLWKLNSKTLKDPHRIYVGQVLKIK